MTKYLYGLFFLFFSVARLVLSSPMHHFKYNSRFQPASIQWETCSVVGRRKMRNQCWLNCNGKVGVSEFFMLRTRVLEQNERVHFGSKTMWQWKVIYRAKLEERIFSTGTNVFTSILLEELLRLFSASSFSTKN